ncbi:hypothetical protein Cpir12675_006775 [Ceratocystis pirilliformis]|uniref:Replication factor A protein 3 n=1 Tax=Ceratocystis pirilliformis TaxID=259994 RepID=A0ABR3YGV8_9PEZI
MADNVSTPRITAPYLDRYINQNVILVGRVAELRGDTAMIESDGMVTVVLNREAHLSINNGVHLIGKVNSDLTLKVLSASDLGPDVDYNMYQDVVQATHQLKSIFVVEA